MGGMLIQNEKNKATQTFVTTALAVDASKNSITLTLTPTDGVTPKIVMSGYGDSGAMMVKFADRPESELYYNNRSGCFEDDETDLCTADVDAGTEIRYHRQDARGEVSLILDPSDSPGGLSMEAPKKYKLSELVNIAKNKSFSSKVQFSVAMQSRDNAMASRLNLLPHVGVNDVVSFATSGINTLGLIKSIGNLAPFLFPSRWFKASALKSQALVDQDSYYIMQADSANMVEGLAYSLMRDQQVYSIYQQYVDSISKLEKLMEARERVGAVTPGSHLNILTVLNALNQTQNSLQTAIETDKISLSRAAGFMNPKAVDDLIAESLPEVALPPIAQDPQLQAQVIARSMELQQFDHLMSAARSNKKATIWSVLDPSGGAFLGFGLGSQIRASRDAINEVIAQKANEQSALLASLQMNLSTLQNAVQNYKIAESNLAVQKDRMRLMSAQMTIGSDVSIIEIQDMYQSALSAEANLLTARFTYHTAAAALNRLLYVGAYSDLGRAQ